MFGRVLALLPIVAIVVSAGQCNTGPIKCCNTYGPANSDSITNDPTYQLSGLASVAAKAGTLVGLGCTSVIGDGSTCQSQPVCCERNDFVNLVGVNCSPITVVG